MSNRNAPCPCGSGRKYKVCCMQNRMNGDGRAAVIVALPQAPPTPEEIAFKAGPKCGDCRHWRKMPKPRVKVDPAAAARMTPQQLREAQEGADLQNLGTDLGGSSVGQCRRRLGTGVVLAQTPQGPQPMTVGGYPGTASDFPACGEFEKAAAVLTEG